MRELAEALEVLAAEAPLCSSRRSHWSDISSVDSSPTCTTARSRAAAVLGRIAQWSRAPGHPLRGIVQELCGRGQGVELRLEFLPAEDVAAYVAGRLGGPVASLLAAFVYERAEGNALFMVNIVEHLVQQGLVVRHEGEWTLREGVEAEVTSLPEGLRQMLVRRIEVLPPEARRVLEAASVVGEEFTVTAVAAGAQCPVEDVEARCDALAAQHHFIEDIGLAAWPDEISGGSYRFRHVLYQQALYEQLGTARRMHFTDALAVSWRRAMAPGRGKSPPCWPSTSSAGVRHYRPSATGSRRGKMLGDGMRITKRSLPSGKPWHCWQR